MNQNSTLNPLVRELIEKDLKLIDKHIEHTGKYIEDLGGELSAAKSKIQILRTNRAVYETILKTGDATLTVPYHYESPKEFKVRE